MPKFFEQGGGRFFISIITTTTREVHSYTHHKCLLVKDWDGVVKHLQELATDRCHLSSVDSIEIFTKPRLCEKCLEHAAQPAVFDIAKDITECLCWIEPDSRCNVHERGSTS